MSQLSFVQDIYLKVLRNFLKVLSFSDQLAALKLLKIYKILGFESSLKDQSGHYVKILVKFYQEYQNVSKIQVSSPFDHLTTFE